MVLSPPGGTVGFRRRMSLRDSLRRVGSKIRQSAGRNRKCRPAVEPTGVAEIAPTVKKCRLDYKRLSSVSERADSPDGNWEERSIDIVRNPYEVVRNGPENVRNEHEDVKNCYELARNGHEVLRSGPERERNLSETVRHDYEAVNHCYEVVRNTQERAGENKYEVVRDKENCYQALRNDYEVIRSEVRSPLRPVNNYEVLKKDSGRASVTRVNPEKRVVLKKETISAGRDNVFVPAANEYEVLRSIKKNDGVLIDAKNNYEVIRKESRKNTRKTFFGGEVDSQKIGSDGVRKEKHKKRHALEGNNRGKHYYDTNNDYKYAAQNCCSKGFSEYDLVDEYLNRPENRGTLNPAFEDFTLKSSLVSTKNKSRIPFQEINVPLDDSFKENIDPKSVTVKRKRKYSVRFDIREEVEEEVTTTRKFGDVIFEESQRRPSILKSSRHLLEEENDSTEELLIRNYELLTKDGNPTRAESNTSKFVRRKFEVVSQDEKALTSEEETEGLPLPVVSLYHAPEDRMPSRRKKKPKKPQDILETKTSSDLRVISISTVDSLNQPATLRTDRLAKIVQKFGPEVLMAMGEDGGDSVLAQFKKSLERTREDPIIVQVDEKEEKGKENVNGEEESSRRGKKRKHVEDIYGKS
ncbi:hypothetical protein J6590_016173 [Homalodisca vitripennis]|nr:hypothetical protein J6590_016173 [Homalodisca vitripennis]